MCPVHKHNQVIRLYAPTTVIFGNYATVTYLFCFVVEPDLVELLAKTSCYYTLRTNFTYKHSIRITFYK